MAKRKPTIKNDKQSKPPRKPTKLTIEDYKQISKELGAHIASLDPGIALFDKLSGLKARVDYKIAQLEKRAREVKKPKEKVKYKCLDCNEIHEKRDTVFKCPTCKSENIEVFA